MKQLTRAMRMHDLTTFIIPEALRAKGLEVVDGYSWEEVVAPLAQLFTKIEFRGKPRDVPTPNQINIAVSFWLRVFEVADPEKREAFEEMLRGGLNDNFLDLRLYVDYDPQGLLLECVRAIGIECSGCMGSADGLFPQKTETYFDQYTGGVKIKLGRGNTVGTVFKVGELDRMLEGYRIGPGSNHE